MSNKSVERFLAQVDRRIEWEPLASLVRAISARVHADVPLPAVKMLLLAHWYGMNDATLIEAFQDRISFRRFLGLSLNDFRDDVQLADVYRRIVAQAPLETQTLIHAIEAQLRAEGYTSAPGMWKQTAIVSVSEDPMQSNVDVYNTQIFQPGEITKLREHRESSVARGGEQVARNPRVMAAAALLEQPQARELAPVQGIVEWPWGATTELKESLNIGRDSCFCPYARELHRYRHISRQHARLMACDDGIWVHDLRSRNGTFVNDQQVPMGQAFLVDCDSSLRCGPNFVILLNLKNGA